MRVRSRSISYSYTLSREPCHDSSNNVSNMKKSFFNPSHTPCTKQLLSSNNSAIKTKQWKNVTTKRQTNKINDICGFQTNNIPEDKNEPYETKKRIFRPIVIRNSPKYQKKILKKKKPKKFSHISSWKSKPFQMFLDENNKNLINTKERGKDLFSVFGNLETKCKSLQSALTTEKKEKQVLTRRLKELEYSLQIMNNETSTKVGVLQNTIEDIENKHAIRLEDTLSILNSEKLLTTKLKTKIKQIEQENEELKKSILAPSDKINFESDAVKKDENTTMSSLTNIVAEERKENNEIERMYLSEKIETQRLQNENKLLKLQLDRTIKQNVHIESENDLRGIEIERLKQIKRFDADKVDKLSLRFTEVNKRYTELDFLHNQIQASKQRVEAELIELKQSHKKMLQSKSKQDKRMSVVASTIEALEDQIQVANQKKNEVNSKLIEANRGLKVAKNKLLRQDKEVKRLETELSTLKAKVTVRNEQIDGKTKLVSLKDKEIDRLKTILNKLEKQRHEKNRIQNNLKEAFHEGDIKILLQQNQEVSKKLLQIVNVD